MKYFDGSRLRVGVFAFVASLFVLSSCNRDADLQSPNPRSSARVRVDKNITEVVVENPNFSLLRAAVVRADLAGALATTNNITVFAPTNAAFQAAGLADEAAINSVPLATLRSILLYHVVGTGRIFSDQISQQPVSVKTLQGEPVTAQRDPIGAVAIDGSLIAQPDLETNNGVIHIIGHVLMPPMGNMFEKIEDTPELSYLLAAAGRVQASGFNIVGALIGSGTVFAPTNAAFQAAGFPSMAAIQGADPNVLRQVLLNHVVPGRVFTSDFNAGEFTTAGGGKLTTTKVGMMATVKGAGNMNAANVTKKNIVAYNGGLIHIVDQVLLPGNDMATKTITEIVVENPNFSLLRAAAIRTGLASALATGDLTVFAPTNAAFQAAGFADETAINNFNVDALRRILLYHVIGTGRIMANSVPQLITEVRTLQGQGVFVLREQRGIFVNGNPVIQANVKATNGVVHVIDKVLMVPEGNLVERAIGTPELSYLVAAVQRAGLVETLVNSTFTVFAPTNAAFQAAGFPTIQSIQNADPNVLKNILLYHVVAGRAYSANLRTNNVPTAQGMPVLVTAMGNTVTVKGKANASASNVVIADVNTINGVVHVIDQVLLP